MKKHLILIILMLFCLTVKAQQEQQLAVLPISQEPDIKDVCLMASNQQFAISESTARDDLNKIFSNLGLSMNNVEVIKCDQLANSALAYYDKDENHYYILVNENKLTTLSDHYFSEFFVIAHEFAHIRKKHLGRTGIITQSQRRQMELEADEYGASIVKLMHGTVDDCIYALQQMPGPTVDTYSDHPTLDKRIAAVKSGFGLDKIDAPARNFENHLAKYNDVALLEYTNSLKAYDLNAYVSETGMVPSSVSYLNNKYWIYWEKKDQVKNYQMFWNYDHYPAQEIQKYFNQNYNVKFIGKVNGFWFVIMLKYPQVFGQDTKLIAKQNFSEKIEAFSAANKGYVVQDVIDADSANYLVLFTKRGDWQKYTWHWGLKPDMTDWFNQQSAKGFTYMMCFKYLDNRYFALMTDKPGVSHWHVVTYDGKDDTNLVNFLNQGFKIDNVTCDNVINFILWK